MYSRYFHIWPIIISINHLNIVSTLKLNSGNLFNAFHVINSLPVIKIAESIKPLLKC